LSRLLRDPSRPGATALSVGLGAVIGATPILGVHTWAAALVAGALRLPPAAALVGSNVSNPLTFIPLTLLEIRVGSWLLGRPLPPLDSNWSWEKLGPYLGAAWVGTIPVALALGALSTVVIYTILRLHGRGARTQDAASGGRDADPSGKDAASDAKDAGSGNHRTMEGESQPRGESGSRSE